MRKKYVFSVIFLLMFLIGISNSESLASFYIKDFEINSEVLSNGDMRVEENITYYSTETKNGVTREIDIENSINSKNSADGLNLIDVKVDGVKATKVFFGNLGDEGVYEYTTSGGMYKLKVYVPFRGTQTRTVTYEYLLKNVGVRYSDTSEIYWNFIGSEWDTKINNLNINIILPQKATTGKIYVFGHGSDNGTFTKRDNYITLNAKNISANQAIDARVLFNVDALSDSTKTINKLALDKYINQEEGLTKKREEPEIFLGLSIKDIASILTIIIVLFGIFVYFKYDKEVKVKKQYYFRDIPYDLPPELLQRIYYGKKCKDSFWITFLNLVKIGVYTIKEATNEIGKKVNFIVYQGKEGKKLKDYQESVITAINGFFEKGENSIDINKLTAKMKRSSGSEHEKFVNKLEAEIEGLFR